MTKTQKKGIYFLDMCVWIGYGKFSTHRYKIDEFSNTLTYGLILSHH